MIYLSSFKLSNKKLKNPNIYPYSVFKDKYIEPFSFAPITIFYGKDVDESKMEEFIAELEDKYDDFDVQCYKGDQPLYYFIMSVE